MSVGSFRVNTDTTDKYNGDVTLTRPASGNTLNIGEGESFTFTYEVQVGGLSVQENNTAVSVSVDLVVIDTYDNGKFIGGTDELSATEDDVIEGTFDYQFRTNETLSGEFDNIIRRAEANFLLNDVSSSKRNEILEDWNEYQTHINRVNKKDEPRVTPVVIRATLDYEFVGETTVIYSRPVTVNVEPEPAEAQEVIRADRESGRGADTLGPAAAEAVEFQLSNIRYPEVYDGIRPGTQGDGPITFDYARPAVSVDSKARYATHEIIGDTTVRQRIGEEPQEISVTGVCTEAKVQTLHALKESVSGKLFAPQLPTDNAVEVQFASVTTEPLEDGGAARFTDGEYLYTYDIKAIEIDEDTVTV